MKTLVILLTLITFSSVAQIEIKPKDETITVKVGKFKSSTYSQGDLQYYVDKGDTAIVLAYCNEKYKTLADYKSITFRGGLKAIDELYRLLKSVNSDKNKDNKEFKVEFKLGKTNISASKEKVMNIKCVFISTDDGYFTILEGQLNKLFAKK